MTAPRSSRPEPISNRSVALGAVALVLILLLGIVIVVLAGDDTPTGSPKTSVPITTPDGSVVPDGERPSSIPQPNEGRAPTDPGDPGGAEQLALFSLLILSVAGIGFVIFRGGKKSQANRARWLAAADEPESTPTGSAGHEHAADQPSDATTV